MATTRLFARHRSTGSPARAMGAAVLGTGVEMAREVAARMTTPLLPDDYFRLLNPLWTGRELRGRVLEVRPETDDAASLVIKPGWGWSFDSLPGQYVGIGVQVAGRWQWRSYSLTSVPEVRQRHITVTVKAMPEGRLSTHLVRGLDPGTIVRLALPRGDFVLPDPPPEKILFWTGGSGITPVVAMLRTLERRATMTDVVHLHSAPSAAQFIFRDELHHLAAEGSGYRLHENLDDEHGLFDPATLDEVCPDWSRREVWVCGPPAMLGVAERHWTLAGRASHLHVERFSLGPTTSGTGGDVTFARSGRSATADGASSVLEVGERLGVRMPFGCRMGICHTCVLPLSAGTVKDLRSGVEHAAPQRVQTCVNVASGDCTFDI